MANSEFLALEQVKGFFPRQSHKAIETLVNRVIAQQAKSAGPETKAAMRSLTGGGPSGSSTGRVISQELGKALSQRGAKQRQEKSVRRTAPDTGGRSFHFAHTVVHKGISPSGEGRIPGGESGPRRGSHALHRA